MTVSGSAAQGRGAVTHVRMCAGLSPRWLRRVSVAVSGVLTLTLLGGCSEDSPRRASERAPSVEVEVIQLRRDQVLERVELAVRNRGGRTVTIDRVRLSVDGLMLPGWLEPGEPLPAGQTVDLPVPLHGIRCPDGDGEPAVGPARVLLRVTDDTTRTTHRLRTIATVYDQLLRRIASRSCAVDRVRRDVDLGFSGRWRLVHASGGDELHGTLQARLRHGDERRIMQLAGAIMYGLRPERRRGDGSRPLAVLTPSRPVARIPVVAWAARCDGHTKGEIKKPYEFLVWVAGAEDSGLAVTPDVGTDTKAALRQVCAF